MMPTNCENASSNMPGSTADLQPNQSTIPEIGSASDHKAVVVGLYGVPGSGKTFLLNQLKQELGGTHFAFYEGSEMIATVVPGGQTAFQSKRRRTGAGVLSTRSARTALTAGKLRSSLDIICSG